MKPGEKVTVESLTLERRADGGLVLAGTLTTPTAQAEFKRILLELHTDLVASRTQRFVVDVRPLRFVNSTAIRAFVDWISRAAHAGYKLSFTTNPSLTWHRLSFSVLKTLAPESVEIEERAGGASV